MSDEEQAFVDDIYSIVDESPAQESGILDDLEELLSLCEQFGF